MDIRQLKNVEVSPSSFKDLEFDDIPSNNLCASPRSSNQKALTERKQKENTLEDEVSITSASDRSLIVKEGVIKKYTNMVSRYQERKFVLHPEVIAYYKEEKAGKVVDKGQISLKVARIVGTRKKKLCIFTGIGVQQVLLKFKSEAEKEEWQSAIVACQENLKLQNESIVQLSRILGYDQDSRDPQLIKEISSFFVEEKKSDEKQNFDLKEANSLPSKITALKDDDNLRRYLGDTLLAYQDVSEAVNELKQEILACKNPLLLQLVKNVEKASKNMKNHVTNAFKQVLNTRTPTPEIQDSSSGNELQHPNKHPVEIEIEYVKPLHQYTEKTHKIKVESKTKALGSQDQDQDMPNESHQIKTSPRESTVYQAAYDNQKSDEKDTEDLFFDAQGDPDDMTLIQTIIDQKHDPNRRQNSFVSDFRETLPTLKPPNEKVSVWKVLKDSIGKDLSRFCVPVYFNEPISMLQKVCEVVEHDQLLVKASQEQDSIKRLLYVSAFAISQYQSSNNRLGKPFNPILGETYELKTENFSFFAEQVSHHPPISACFSSAKTYDFWMNTNMKTSFWGKSLEVKPIGYQHVRLKGPIANGEHYIIDRPISSVQNIIIGKMYLEHYGSMMVKNLRTGESCLIDFKKRGWSGKNAFEIEGTAYAPMYMKVAKIFGKWTDSLYISDMESTYKECIWSVPAFPEDYEFMYYFTHFALQLNHLPPGLKEKLPPTDSRLRPDQRALEEGNLLLAAQEKARLEDKQRTQRKYELANRIYHEPAYFQQSVDPESGEEQYTYLGKYWEDRESGNWSHLKEIF